MILYRDFEAGVYPSVLYPPPPRYTLYTTYMYLFTHGRGGESWTREKGRGATDPKAGQKIPTWLNVSPVYSLWKTPAATNDDILHCLLCLIFLRPSLFSQLIRFQMFNDNIATAIAYTRIHIYPTGICCVGKCTICALCSLVRGLKTHQWHMGLSIIISISWSCIEKKEPPSENTKFCVCMCVYIYA